MASKLDALALALSAKNRRNPLKKGDAKKAVLELKKAAIVEATKRPDQVYGLYWEQDGDIHFFYVGTTITPTIRFQQHCKAVKQPWNLEDKYAVWRELESAGRTIQLAVLDEEGEFTESHWCKVLRDDGHLLTNMVDGVDVKRKVTTTTTKKVLAATAPEVPVTTPCKGVLALLKRTP